MLLEENTCVKKCTKGYVKKQKNVNKCTKCFEGCKECVDGEYLMGDKCLIECPSGFEPATLDGVPICITSSNAPTIILVNFPSPDEKVPLNQDLIIQTEISSFGDAKPLVWWDTLGVPKPTKDILFRGLNINNSNLIIPKHNLLPDTNYTLMISASVEEDSSSHQFTFTTVKNIVPGTFTVTPNQGNFFSTVFTVRLESWSQEDATLFFDVSTYYEEFDPVTEKMVIKGRIAVQSNIPNSASPITVSFKVPPAEVDREQIVEVITHSDTASLTQTKIIKLSVVEPAQLAETVKNTDITAITDPNEIINFGKASLAIYDLSADEKAAIDAGINVVQNYAVLTNETDFCPDDIYCSGFGTCSIVNKTRICTCDEDHAGQYCQFDKTNFDKARRNLKILIEKIIALPLNNATANQIVSALKIMTAQPAFLDYETLSRVVELTENVTDSGLVDQNTAVSILEGISNLLKAASSSPELKSNNLNSLFRVIEAMSASLINALGTGESIRIVSDEYETQVANPVDSLDNVCGEDDDEDEEDNRLLALKRVSPRRIPKRRKCLTKLKKALSLTSSLGSSFELPKLTFQAKSKVTFSLQEFKNNQRGASNADQLISSTTSLEIKDGDTPILIQDLKEPIVIQIPKISPTDPSKVKVNYQCTYYDPNTNLFKTDGCTLIGETFTHIICACVHLTEFAVTIDTETTNEVIVKPQISLNAMFETQAAELANSKTKPTYTFNFFTKKFQKYITTPIDRPFKMWGVFFVLPMLIIFLILFKKAYTKPYLDEEVTTSKKGATISDIIQAKKAKAKVNKSAENSNSSGITAAALFSPFTTRIESIKLPRHIRLLYLYAHFSIMIGIAALLSYIFGGMESLKSILDKITTKFVVILGGFATIILGNLVYDLTVGCFNYHKVHKAPTPTTNKEANSLRKKQTILSVFLIITFNVIVFVMLMLGPKGIKYFPWMVLIALVIDYLVIDIAVWVYCPVSKKKILRTLLLARGFFIEDLVDINAPEYQAAKLDQTDVEAFQTLDTKKESSKIDLIEDKNSKKKKKKIINKKVIDQTSHVKIPEDNN